MIALPLAALVIVPETTPVPTPKVSGLLAIPPTVTITFPVVAAAGTGTTMLEVLQLVGVADTPLNWTTLTICVGPKFEPESVTGVPCAPKVGEIAVKSGAGPKARLILIVVFAVTVFPGFTTVT